jgi:hypothetical protein
VTRQRFIDYLRSPGSLTEGQLKELQQLLVDHPYFSIGRSVLAKAALETKHAASGKLTAKAALYAIDRTHLKRYLSDDLIFLSPAPQVSEEPAVEQAKQEELPRIPEFELPKSERPAVVEETKPEPITTKSEISGPDFSTLDAPEPEEVDQLLDELQRDMEALRKSREHFLEIQGQIDQEPLVTAVQKTPTEEPKAEEIVAASPVEEPTSTVPDSVEIKQPELQVSEASEPIEAVEEPTLTEPPVATEPVSKKPVEKESAPASEADLKAELARLMKTIEEEVSAENKGILPKTEPARDYSVKADRNAPKKKMSREEFEKKGGFGFAPPKKTKPGTPAAKEAQEQPTSAIPEPVVEKPQVESAPVKEVKAEKPVREKKVKAEKAPKVKPPVVEEVSASVPEPVSEVIKEATPVAEQPVAEVPQIEEVVKEGPVVGEGPVVAAVIEETKEEITPVAETVSEEPTVQVVAEETEIKVVFSFGMDDEPEAIAEKEAPVAEEKAELKAEPVKEEPLVVAAEEKAPVVEEAVAVAPEPDIESAPKAEEVKTPAPEVPKVAAKAPKEEPKGSETSKDQIPDIRKWIAKEGLASLENPVADDDTRAKASLKALLDFGTMPRENTSISKASVSKRKLRAMQAQQGTQSTSSESKSDSKSETSKGSEKKGGDDDESGSSGLIEKFIQESPSINKDSDAPKGDLASKSTKWNKELASEHLAEIYLKQGNKTRAIDIYKALSLKFPEKKDYFAALIDQIKK